MVRRSVLCLSYARTHVMRHAFAHSDVRSKPFRSTRPLSLWSVRLPSWTLPDEIRRHVCSMYDHVITSSCVPDGVTRTPCDLGGGLKAYWFTSAQIRHQAEAARFIFYVHPPTSGGPSSSTHRALASQLAIDAGAAVLMVDYSRTPEYTREEAQADINKAYRWVTGQPGVIPASMLIMADGLGCALALNLCVELRDETVAGGDDLLPAVSSCLASLLSSLCVDSPRPSPPCAHPKKTFDTEIPKTFDTEISVWNCWAVEWNALQECVHYCSAYRALPYTKYFQCQPHKML